MELRRVLVLATAVLLCSHLALGQEGSEASLSASGSEAVSGLESSESGVSGSSVLGSRGGFSSSASLSRSLSSRSRSRSESGRSEGSEGSISSSLSSRSSESSRRSESSRVSESSRRSESSISSSLSSRLSESSRRSESSRLSSLLSSRSSGSSLYSGSSTLGSLNPPPPPPPPPAPAPAPAPVSSSSAVDQNTEKRSVNSFTNENGAKVTIIANKNRLVHVRTPTAKLDTRQIEEQSRKQVEEEKSKKEADQERAEKKEEDKKKKVRLEADEKRKDEQGQKEAKAARERARREAEEVQAKQKQAEEQEKVRRREDEKRQEAIRKRQEEERKQKDKAEAEAAQKQKEENEKKMEKQRLEEVERKKVEEQDIKKKQEAEVKKKSVILQSGAENYGNGYRDASFDIWENVCFVSGLVKTNGGHFATLGDTCRPKDGRLVLTLLKGDVPSRVDVLPDGRVYHIAGGGSGWISLDGLFFTLDRPSDAPLSAPWVNYGGEYRPSTYAKKNELCIFSGLIRSGAWGNYMVNPGNTECKPQDGRLIFTANNHDQITRLDVLQSNGLFIRSGGYANHGWVSLDGIAFTPSGGNGLQLASGWGNYANGYRGASWTKVGPVCSLSGLIRGNFNSHIATLPDVCRPNRRLIFHGNVHMSSARIDVLPSGEVHYIAGRQPWDWISLDNIKYIPTTEPKSVAAATTSAQTVVRR